jgi:hypothetical protein
MTSLQVDIDDASTIYAIQENIHRACDWMHEESSSTILVRKIAARVLCARRSRRFQGARDGAGDAGAAAAANELRRGLAPSPRRC